MSAELRRWLARLSVVASLVLANCGAPGASMPASSTGPSRHRDPTDELIALSKQARWAFPSSTGRPVEREAPPWATRLANERAALVTAVRRLNDQGERSLAVELAANTWRAWVLARDEAGGRAFLSLVLDGPDATQPSRARALALYGDSLFAFRLGELAASRARGEAALAMARNVADREAEGLALLALSRVELSEHRPEDARTHALESRAALGALGPAYTQAPLHFLAQAARAAGNRDEAAARFEESLALNRRIGDQTMVLVELDNLGNVELRRGDADKAERYFDESAALSGNRDDPYDTAMRFFKRAAIAFARGDRAGAARLLEEARGVVRLSNVTLAMDDAQEVEDLERRLEAQR